MHRSFLFDGGGLYLLVKPNGSCWWRFKYRHLDKEKLPFFGTFPEISLKDARERRGEARKQLPGVDPGEHRKARKSALAERCENSFEVAAHEWCAKYRPTG